MKGLNEHMIMQQATAVYMYSNNDSATSNCLYLINVING